MTAQAEHANAPALDRPWHRPGALRYAAGRVRGALRPPVTVYEPAPASIVIDRDVEVPTRDGTILRVNVHRPIGTGPFPVLLSAHPYGKDRTPQKKRGGRWSLPFQYRALRQTDHVRFSNLTGWEAPDPAWWTAKGFVMVNCDLRGAGTSDGTGSLMSDQEGEDVHDLIEWAAVQHWSTGAVGMIGVSYLAISQWKAAATQPPHLRAIVPWEGFTDAYRGLLHPGGVRENGFLKLWQKGLKGVRLTHDLGEESRNRPLYDDFYRSLVPDLTKIEVPALICGSFSDNNLHSRGSFDGYERIGSAVKHVYTHRGGKWATFYSDEALGVQFAFVDRHLRGGDSPVLPNVRLEVRERRDRIASIRDERSWPLPSTTWTPLALSNAGLQEIACAEEGSISFDTRKGGARFGWTVPEDIEIVGPMALRLFVEVDGADDVDLIVGVEKWRGKRYVPFEGSYGFGRDRVATGWQTASLRALDPQRSRSFEPVPACTAREPLAPGQIVPVDIAVGPSATLFRGGETLRLVVSGRWLWSRSPLIGQFPAAFVTGPSATCTLHWGPEHQAQLLIPVISPTS